MAKQLTLWGETGEELEEPGYVDVVKEPRAPFPYFGGKRNCAPAAWAALGDVGHYVEPFCGSCAMLLARPRLHTGTVETVNDADGMLVNAWRAMRDDPDGVARICADPVMEIELHARLAFVKERMTPDFTAWMEGGPDHFDTRLAGYWIYSTCASIGTCWNDDGPWRVVDGKLVKTRENSGGGTESRKNCRISAAGGRVFTEVAAPSRRARHHAHFTPPPHTHTAQHAGIFRQLPHLGDAGRGVNRASRKNCLTSEAVVAESAALLYPPPPRKQRRNRAGCAARVDGDTGQGKERAGLPAGFVGPPFARPHLLRGLETGRAVEERSFCRATQCGLVHRPALLRFARPLRTGEGCLGRSSGVVCRRAEGRANHLVRVRKRPR